jgi:hypothetical protein
MDDSFRKAMEAQLAMHKAADLLRTKAELADKTTETLRMPAADLGAARVTVTSQLATPERRARRLQRAR